MTFTLNTLTKLHAVLFAGSLTLVSSAMAADAPLNTPLRDKALHGIMQNDYEPLVYLDEQGNNTGYFYEIVAAAAKKLGAKIEVKNGTFDSFIPGLQSGRYDFALGTDATVERQKIVDIIPLIDAGYSFITKTSGPVRLDNSLTSLCGHSVAALAGQSTLEALSAQADQCKTSGLAELKIAIFPSRSAAWLAVKSGQAELTPVYTGEAGWITKKDPDWRVTGPTFNRGQSGFSVNKQQGNAQAWASAVNALIADGTYQQILKKYGVESVALKEIIVNPQS
ncbi:transporter substrate-binding domain-containing protein (plasmid) [Erwinia rhapontici]|uniref:transporter substrate-binding domain-containing protein n=1 Tax=Erwinia rhapontici TaxID=55212 RepID=UPI0014384C06|nr:transporter substrate-binding domain-containing protein [Erwinia rhapontici]NKG29376.1 transporter substrate-binding domain-containing protein [Erwinia rhapontici]